MCPGPVTELWKNVGLGCQKKGPAMKTGPDGVKTFALWLYGDRDAQLL
jgi:hypothetical protein